MGNLALIRIHSPASACLTPSLLPQQPALRSSLTAAAAAVVSAASDGAVETQETQSRLDSSNRERVSLLSLSLSFLTSPLLSSPLLTRCWTAPRPCHDSPRALVRLARLSLAAHSRACRRGCSATSSPDQQQAPRDLWHGQHGHKQQARRLVRAQHERRRGAHERLERRRD